MPRPSRQRGDTLSPEEAQRARIDYVIHRAAVAAVLANPAGAMTLLDIPNEELGRMFKKRLWEVIGVSTIVNIDLSSMRDEDANLGKRLRRKSKLRTPESEELVQSGSANFESYDLVRQGKLLPMDDFLAAANVTQKKLNKSVGSGKIFSVELEDASYIPAFFLSAMIHRNDFAKVIRKR
jgi:hypothetical protein